MSTCYCCATRHVRDRRDCTCRGGTCRRHAPLCREHCDCGPQDDDRDAEDLLNDSDGPFGDLLPLPRSGDAAR
ncbi:MAG: hypothetical protein K2X87_04850 [Gemmataceae bacterium]|nr:hypothetical protein [Gemmataceae bacterium]